MEINKNTNWNKVSRTPGLSENFIEKFKDKVNWHNISAFQQLSETFIEKHKDKVKWNFISFYQQLSEPFIEKYKDKVNWYCISRCQQLSEPFIEKFKDKVNWYNISRHQKLSESFIEKYKDKVDWYNISIYQKLSEEFIEKHKDRVYWIYISEFQKLSEEFRNKYNITVPKYSWIYKDKNFKLNYLKENKSPYEIIDNNYILAYKSTRIDGYSVFNFQYKYKVGKTYEAHCDCNQDAHNSFGLSAWTKEKALEYHSYGKLFLVKIDIDDIGVIIPDYKIRAKKLTILEEVKK